jgi:hypothetical protein
MVIALLLAGIGMAHADALTSFGLRAADPAGCTLTDGKGFEAPTIVLMISAYGDQAGGAFALELIDKAIAAGCEIDEPDQMGLSPLNAAILYNEPVLVERLLRAGANPDDRIVSSSKTIDGLNSSELLALLESRSTKPDREAVRRLLESPPD